MFTHAKKVHLGRLLFLHLMLGYFWACALGAGWMLKSAPLLLPTANILNKYRLGSHLAARVGPQQPLLAIWIVDAGTAPVVAQDHPPDLWRIKVSGGTIYWLSCLTPASTRVPAGLYPSGICRSAGSGSERLT